MTETPQQPRMTATEARNWAAHALDGGLYMGAIALVHAQTLLPTIVQDLHGPECLVALMPSVMTLGSLAAPMFTAHAIGRLTHFRPILLLTGIFQRLAYLVSALVLLVSHDPRLCLTAVVLAPFAAGICGGVANTGWQQLLARTISPARRSSLFAGRFTIGSLLGIAAGWVVHSTLSSDPGLRGYGLLYLWTFVILCASYVAFATIREPKEPAAVDPEIGLWDNVKSIPSLLAEDKKLVCLMASVCAFGFTGAMIPNLAIHARHVCRAPESFLGDLLSWQMVGAIAGCLIAGWCGDRSGSKMPLQVGRVLFLVVCIAAPIASSVWAWRLLFLAFGAAFYACAIGSSTIQLEILPSTGRASRLAIMSANQIPVTIAASLAGGLAWKVAHEAAFPWLAAIAAVGTAASIIILIKLPEPRTATKELLT